TTRWCRSSRPGTSSPCSGRCPPRPWSTPSCPGPSTRSTSCPRCAPTTRCGRSSGSSPSCAAATAARRPPRRSPPRPPELSRRRGTSECCDEGGPMAIRTGWAAVALATLGLGACAQEADGVLTAPTAESTTTTERSTTTEPTTTTVATTTTTGAESVSQANARRAAAGYLDVLPFSRQGLIEQLEFEGYSTEDATYAVDSLDVDWYEQAALMAQSYLDVMPFSRQGLIDQLVFEGFTPEEAAHGADSVGL